jgi:hypothetical protein
MIPLSEYLHPSAAESLVGLGVPVLLVGLRDGAAASNEFRTSTHPAAFRIPTLADALASDSACLVPLAKSDRNPYQNFIFVGRASTCDVILRDSSVSKSHALFERHHDPAADTWFVRDNRSHNGTWIDGTRVPRGSRVDAPGGAVIVFGAYPTYLIMPAELRLILGAMTRAHA